MFAICYQIRQQYFWKNCDSDLRWLLQNYGPAKMNFKRAIYNGWGFENFLARIPCPNGCAYISKEEAQTRICTCCNVSGTCTPAAARKRIAAIEREANSVHYISNPFFYIPNNHAN